MPAHYRPLQRFTIGLGFGVRLGLFSPIRYFTVSHTSPLYRPAPAQKQRRNCPAYAASMPVQRRFTGLHSLHHFGATVCTVLVHLHRFGALLPYPALKARGGSAGLYYYYSTCTDLQEGKIELICYKKSYFYNFYVIYQAFENVTDLALSQSMQLSCQIG